MAYTIFIGSSSEGKLAAQALSLTLSRRDFESEAWYDDFFAPGNTTHTQLLKKASSYDFAAFLVTADDQLFRRGREVAVPRDNVIWEMGLFTGILGPERCFLIWDSDKRPELPSDYAGVTVVPFKRQHDAQSGEMNWVTSLAQAANTIHFSALNAKCRTKPVMLPEKLEKELGRIRTSAEAVNHEKYFRRWSFQVGIHSHLRSWRAKSSEWKEGRVTILPPDYIEFLGSIYREAKRNVFSTCIPDYIQLFNTPVGAGIINAHRENRTAKVTRVFVFNHKGDENDYLQILETQKHSRIRVLLYFDKDETTFNFPPNHGNDWTIIDDGDIIGVTQQFGKEYEAQWHFADDQKRPEFQKLMEQLISVSVDF